MKRWILAIIAVALLLAGCEEAGYVYSDPADQRAWALETKAAADAKIRSTQDASLRQAARATQEAATQQAYTLYQMELLQAQIQGTRAAFDIESTATVQAYQAQRAQLDGMILAGKETQAYQATGTPFAATQAALVRQVQKDATRDWWTNSIVIPVQTMMPAIVTIIIIIGVIVLAIFFFREVRYWIRRLMPAVEMKMRMHTAPDGRIIFVLDPKHLGQLFLDPSRMLTPGMMVNENGMTPTGGADDSLQYNVTSNAQKIEALRATNTKTAAKREAPLPPVEGLRIEVVDDKGDVGAWVDEVEAKFLEA